MLSISWLPFAPFGGMVRRGEMSLRSVGVLVASFLREWLNIYIVGSFDHSKCSDEMITVYL